MYPLDPQSLLGNNMWSDMGFRNEHTAAYPNGTYSQCGPEETFENLPFDTNSIPQDEKALAMMSSLGYAVAPADVGPAASVKPSFIPLAPEVGTQGVDFLFDSPPVVPFQSDLACQQSWHEQHSAYPFTPEASHGYPSIPTQEPWEHGYPVAEAVEAKPYGYGTFHLGESERRSILKKHRYEASAYRIEGQETRFVCTVESCGKNFSGEWEKTRHIKSMHRPPTIGCRKCNYKQSRKDLFSEHCKKRHPGESIEDLRVQLDVPDA